MYFKQIELLGFKSFADKTQVNLERGITAIVGPNGCGKSNILDAMRWALGEQSAKALRGAHMQDVIFNGSEQRPPTGMAEVTLTFDNADSRLPIDFSEVQITRRVYRSGESEYLLNKAPCRLRDIQELFMDTGIGTNAYSLIGQGKIDLVLSSKPEDRRFLFEEAAGIIKYKSRKRVAMRKLDSAEQNLLRLNDIIAEVQRQMRSLKRQVNAAIRHRELTAALRELEIRNAWLHFNELSGQIEDLRERYAIAQDEYEAASSQTATLEAQLEELNLKRIELDRMLMARRDGEHQIDSEMEKIESQIALIRKEIDFTKQQQEQALKENDAFKERAEAILKAQGEAGEQASALNSEISAVESALAGKQADLEALQKKVQEADDTLEVMRDHAMQSLNDRNKTQTELETLAVGLRNVDTQLETIYTRQENLNARHADLTGQLNNKQQQESEAQKRLTATVQDRQGTQETRKTRSARMQALNTEWQELREQKSSQEARLTSLRELRDSYEGFATGVRAVMMAKQKGMAEMTGVIGPVGDLLSTEKEYERAIEAALGGNINNVVVEEADAAKSAIAFLKKHQAGRVTFLPLDTIRASSHDDSNVLAGMPGVIGKAISQVQCDAYIMPAVEYLLFNTIIVETIDDAIRIARSERRFPRLVTLEGEVVSSAGAVTGGRTRHDSRGLLGRSAEIEELEAKVEQAAARIKTVGAEAQALALEMQQLSATIAALEEREGEERAALNAIGVDLARLSTELESLNQGIQQMGQERDTLLGEREALEGRRGAAQERIGSMEDDDQSLQRKIADAQEHASKSRQAMSACGDALTELRMKLASLTQSIQENERNKLREQQEYEAALRDAEQRIDQVAGLRTREQELESHIADNLERVKGLSETREEAHGKVLEAQQEQQGVLEKTDTLSKDLKTSREKSGKAQKEVHTLELDLSQKEERVSYFQERILEEYNLGLASLDEEEVGTDEYDEKEREKLIADHRRDLQRLGTVNLMAIEEYEELEKRDCFLTTQDADLRQARDTLLSVVARIDETILQMFLDTFKLVSENFKSYFRRLFNGGQARIFLVDESDPLESGIEIEARPPGKKPQTISLLSGGEQAMTAIALLFAIFTAKPSPFCVLDEVDAPLDDANIGRFLSMVDNFADENQFIMITHNKQTMAKANALYGVTQQERGVSQLVSVRIEDVEL